jgi:PKD repeat protein
MRLTMLTLGILLAATLAGSATAASYRSAPSEPVTGGFDPVQRAAEQRALHDQLWAEKLVVTEPGVRVRLNDEDRRALSETVNQGNRQVPAERRQRIGVVKPVAHGVDFAGMGAAPTRPKAFAGGQLLASGGGLTWTALVRAEGATASRLHFTGVDLPDGAELFVFNERGQAYGPYTGTGRNGNGAFWSEALIGTDTYVHLRVPGGLSTAELRGLRFVINDVGHIGPDYRYVDVWSACEGNANCVKLAKGATTHSAVEDAKQAVAHMQFVSGAFIYFCSGGLINDSDNGSDTPPYFLTANHCLSKNNEANSLQTYFNFVDCGNATQPPMATGASILSSSRTSDYTLLLLNEVPTGTTLLGWNSTPIATADDTALYRISHPSGAPQAYSEHVVDTSRPTCRSWPRGPWIYSSDTFGATEGGSSGSPVVNAAGEVVGQLSGACGYETSNVCSNRNATVDGAFAAYFNDVAQWLDPAPSSGNNPPNASFSINGDPAVVFTDTSTDPDGDSISSWAWNFGDGGNSSLQSPPAHTYACNGTYNVTLTVEDTNGASDTASNTVTIGNGTNCATSDIGVLPISGAIDDSGRRPAVTFTINVATSNGGSPSGAVVSGDWGGLAKGSGSCTVSGSSCEVTKGNIRGSGDVTFTVTGIELSGYTFNGIEQTGKVAIP